MTTSDIAAALTSAALVGFVATLIIREHLRELRVRQALLVADMRADDRAADLAADVLAEVARRRAEDEAWRRIQAAVDAAAFDRMRDRIRALPETSEEIDR